MSKVTTVLAEDFARRHGIDFEAEMLESEPAPDEPTGKRETWRWAATTGRGCFEVVDETDGSGSHDPLDRLFGVWQGGSQPSLSEFVEVLKVLGGDATMELGELVGWEKWE